MAILATSEKAIGWVLPSGQFQEVGPMGHLGYAREEVKQVFGVEPQDPERTLLVEGYVKIGFDGCKRHAKAWTKIKARQYQTLAALGVGFARYLKSGEGEKL